MRLTSRFASVALMASLAGCNGRVVATGDVPHTGTPPVGYPGPPLEGVDLLFMIDNSAGMAAKQALLAATIPDLLQRLTSPRCIDAQGAAVGSSVSGACASGALEFAPVTDLHVGVVSSSLGGGGSDACDANVKNPVHPSLSTHNDDRGHLLDRAGSDEHAVPDAQATSFLSWAPGSATPGSIADATALAGDFRDMVSGVHEYGCGFEAQLESWYRFLIQPDPYASIAGPPSQRATLVGVDDTIIQQRHDFLRPNSAVAIIVLTDENDSTIDPLAIAGQAWAFEDSHFPRSPSGGAARATAVCESDPNDVGCTSCGFALTPTDSSCAENQGYYDPQTEDPLNERFFHMKRRFGVDPQFPITRYVNALTLPRVPNRDGEHPNGSNNYVGTGNCGNPLFSSDLPTTGDSPDALCNLTKGPRTADQVFFTVIAGVPGSLLRDDPSDPTSAPKGKLSASDWVAILGNDPATYDFRGADPHMLESMVPRSGLPGPTASDTADPIHGREQDTANSDLQYACTFPLPAPIDCNDPQYTSACDCNANRKTNPPLCASPESTLQIRSKAYPAIRELSVARALGDQAIVSSICPVHAVEASPGDPLYGYRPAWDALVTRMRTVLPAK